MNNGLFSIGLAKRNIDLSMNMSMGDGLECAEMAQNLALSAPSFLKHIGQRFRDRVKSKKP